MCYMKEYITGKGGSFHIRGVSVPKTDKISNDIGVVEFKDRV